MTMRAGFHSICLKTDDLSAMRRFYETLGMVTTHADDQWVQLTNGNLELSLMTFLEENWINIRGADVRETHQMARKAGLECEGEPEHYTAGQMGYDGWHWMTRDPAGNVVYFDTTDEEAPLSHRVKTLLEGIELQLDGLGLQSSTFQAFKDELIGKAGGE